MALENESKWFTRQWWAKIIILALAYFVSAKVGLFMSFLGTSASPVWPPTGVAFAAVLLWGYRIWPGIFIGEFSANFLTFLENDFALGPSILATSGMSLGNTLEAVVGLLLIRAFIRNHDPFYKVKDVVKFIFLAALIATSISATIGVSCVCLWGIGPWADFIYLWWTWWVGNAVGALVVTPIIVAWYKDRFIRINRRCVFEASLVFGILATVAWLAFGVPQQSFAQPVYPLEYLVLPLAMWATFRFGRRGATLAIFLTCAIAIYFTALGSGPFMASVPNDSLLLLQFSLAVLAITILIVNAALLERKLVENALRESEDQYRTLAVTSPDGIVMTDVQGNITYASPQAATLYNVENRNDLLGKSFLEYVLPKEKKRSADAYHALLEVGELRGFISTYAKREGESFIGETNATLVGDANGQPKAIIATTRDITDRKRAEEQRLTHARFIESLDWLDRVIRQTVNMEEMLGELLEVVLSVFKCDRAWLIFPCDPNASSVKVPMERTRPEYPGAHVLNIDIPMSAGMQKDIRNILDTQEPMGLQFMSGECDWGTEKKYGIKSKLIMAIHPKTGEPWVFGIHQCSDVHLWTQGEIRLFKEIGRRIGDALSSLLSYRELRQSEERFRALTENTTDLTVIIGRDGTFRYISPAVESIYGYSAAEVIGRSPQIVIHSDDFLTAKEIMKKAIQNCGTSLPVNAIRVKHKDGSWVLLEGLVTCMFDEPSVNGIVFNGRDITERKQAEQERERLIAKLETQNAELERFAYTVSHDLKSPLFTVKGFIGLLEEDIAEKNEEAARDDIMRISDAIDKMEQLLRELLELSRIGRLVNPPEEMSLKDIAMEAKELISGQIEEKNVQVDIDPSMPKVYGDRYRLLEVIQNLLDNSVKYMGDQVQPRIKIGTMVHGDKTVCYVKDNGIGIESRHQSKIFGLFEQLDQNAEGSGIGLAVVKRIVEVHGGNIWVESQGEGQGTTFFFALPFRRSSQLPPRLTSVEMSI